MSATSLLRRPSAAAAALAFAGAAVLVPFSPSPAAAAPSLSVSKTSGLDPAGETITVTGSGYDESKGIYVALCVDNGAGQAPSPCIGGADMDGDTGASKWISNDPPSYGEGLAQPYGSGGSFRVQLRVQAADQFTDCLTAANGCVVATRRDHLQTGDRSQDVRIPVTFRDPSTGGGGGGGGGGGNGGGGNDVGGNDGGGSSGGDNRGGGGDGGGSSSGGSGGSSSGGSSGGSSDGTGGSSTANDTSDAPEDAREEDDPAADETPESDEDVDEADAEVEEEPEPVEDTSYVVTYRAAAPAEEADEDLAASPVGLGDDGRGGGWLAPVLGGTGAAAAAGGGWWWWRRRQAAA